MLDLHTRPATAAVAAEAATAAAAHAAAAAAGSTPLAATAATATAMAAAANAQNHSGSWDSDEEMEEHEELRGKGPSMTERTSRAVGLLLDASHASNAELKRELGAATEKLSEYRRQIAWLEQKRWSEPQAWDSASRQRTNYEREIAGLKRAFDNRVASWRLTQTHFAALEKENKLLDTRMERWTAERLLDMNQRDAERRAAEDVRLELVDCQAENKVLLGALSPGDVDLHAELRAANRRAGRCRRQLAGATAEARPGADTDTPAYAEGTAAHRERAQLIDRIRVLHAKAQTDADQMDMFFSKYTRRHWPEKDRVPRCAAQAAALFSSEQRATDLQDRLDTLRKRVKEAAAAAESAVDTGATGAASVVARGSPENGPETDVTLDQTDKPMIGKSHDEVAKFDLTKSDHTMTKWNIEIAAEMDSLDIGAGLRGDEAISAAALAAETTWSQDARRDGLTVHRGDHGCPPAVLSMLRNAARDYLPNKVDKLFNVRPVWRMNRNCVLLPQQTEDKDRGCREIGKKQAPSSVTQQVWNMLKKTMPAHNGKRLSHFHGRALKPLFRHRGCPAQPCHRDGAHGLSVIIPLTEDYVIYFHPWRRANDYKDAGAAMIAQEAKTGTDRIAGPPTMITANPGDVIIFDKRIAHFGGPARSQDILHPGGVDTAWPSNDSKRPITDVSWHIHLDDPWKDETLLSDGGDPVYYVHSSESSMGEELTPDSSDDDEGEAVRERPARNDDQGRPDGSRQIAPVAAVPSGLGRRGLPMAAATSGTPSGDSTGDERGDECGVDGHLDLAKAAAETDIEYIRRLSRDDARQDQEWQERISAATAAENDRLAVQWDQTDSAGVGNRIRSRKRGRR